MLWTSVLIATVAAHQRRDVVTVTTMLGRLPERQVEGSRGPHDAGPPSWHEGLSETPRIITHSSYADGLTRARATEGILQE